MNNIVTRRSYSIMGFLRTVLMLCCFLPDVLEIYLRLLPLCFYC